MDIQEPLQLLGGLSPQQFMKRHWQKKPLLVRQAIPGFKPLLERSALVIVPVVQAQFKLVTEFAAPSARGEGGYGSTGKH